MHECFINSQTATKTMSNANGHPYTSGNAATVTERQPAWSISESVVLQPETLARLTNLQQVAFEFFAQVMERYPAENLMFSFNGGKDCTVLLDLLIKFCAEHKISHEHIPLLYIKSEDAFAEMDEFVDDCVRHYGVKLVKYSGPLKEALTRMCTDMPHIEAVFLGSRNSDPHCAELTLMQPTDNGWPHLMRLSPILEWCYYDVWNYIRLHKVPYCRLYDQGYTSVGYRSNTVPNPHLRHSSYGCPCSSDTATAGHTAVECRLYRPAYELSDGALERAGRLPRRQ